MWNWVDHLIRDLRFGVRGLLRTPGFTLLAVASLALGIMATTAIYSVLHAVVLDPFPYKDVDRLTSVRVWSPAQRGFRTSYSVDQFLEIAGRATIFDGVIASTISDVLWTGDGDPQRLRGNHGTFNTFEVMGVPPLIGRTPLAADAAPGAEPVAVLGYRFWQRQFAGDPQVLGRQLRLNGTMRTVIGVMPKRFMWRGADVYIPVAFQRGQTVEGVTSVHLLGRLKADVSDAAAEADLAPIIADLRQREPAQFPEEWRVGLLSFKQTFPSAITGDIWILLGAVALLLLIACANVSNLLLSRAAARQKEITVRAALGASRWRLVRQLLAESLVLALAAGVAGTALAYAALPALLALVPPGRIPDESEIVINVPVLLFALGVSAAASLVCGLAPALHTARKDLAAALKESGRGLAGGSRQALFRKGLIVTEVALSLVLLAGSGVLLRAFLAMQRVDLDVSPDQVLTFRVPLSPTQYPDAARRAAFFHELLERLSSVPGVAAAALNSGLHPLGNMRVPATVPGQTPSEEPVMVHHVTAAYAETMKLRVTVGRGLTDAEVRGAQQVALVNQRFVRTRLDGRNPIGEVFELPRLTSPPYGLASAAFTIVGVVEDVPNAGLGEPTMPEALVPFTVLGLSNLVVVRAHGRAADVTRAVVGQVYAVDAGQPVTGVSSLAELLDEIAYATPRFNLVLLSLFAGLGLALAVIGVYGVMSQAVSQETQEIGLRMALGAGTGRITTMIMLRGLRLLLLGVALGLAGSYAAGQWLAGQIWRVDGFDAASFLMVTGLMLGVGLQACFWPARRAARTDPLIALRQE